MTNSRDFGVTTSEDEAPAEMLGGNATPAGRSNDVRSHSLEAMG
ncbi:MAG: hypothetical protein NZ941_03830 [Candidatus Caldarchaeum sp.]|nr:hypothetical protein [Candidatus Caldarchaeum sp.]